MLFHPELKYFENEGKLELSGGRVKLKLKLKLRRVLLLEVSTFN